MIDDEQRKLPGKRIFRLSKSHTMEDCFIKKECNKLVTDWKTGASSSIPITKSSSHLRHINYDNFQDAVSDDVADDLAVDSSNDTNEDELLYFARVTNHYLHLVKTTSPVPMDSRHIMWYPFIADSGANYHMF